MMVERVAPTLSPGKRQIISEAIHYQFTARIILDTKKLKKV